MAIKEPRFWGLHANPPQWMRWMLAALPFVLCLIVYMVASDIRHKENPQDKILPSLTQMKNAVYRMAFTEDTRTGDYLMLKDTTSSLRRIAIAIFFSALLGLILGINIGLFPGLDALSSIFVTFVSIIPPLALLPILFISFGVDELAKIMLIFIGTFPLITRDIFITVKKMPKEMITKALTLGATPLQVAYQIVLPQVFPRLLDTLRLSFGAGWLFLIASEAIASTDGLGYRIFLVRRYLAMDIIIPYTIWITFLGFATDWCLKKLILWKFQWYRATTT